VDDSADVRQEPVTWRSVVDSQPSAVETQLIGHQGASCLHAISEQSLSRVQLTRPIAFPVSTSWRGQRVRYRPRNRIYLRSTQQASSKSYERWPPSVGCRAYNTSLFTLLSSVCLSVRRRPSSVTDVLWLRVRS